MQKFIEKFRDEIQGVLSGFDRLIFRGSLPRLNQGYWDQRRRVFVARGMEEYCWQNQILFKDYFDHVKQVSEELKNRTKQSFHEQKLPWIYLRDPKADKEQVARQCAREQGIGSGLVCAISVLEPSPTFEHSVTNIIRRVRPSHVIYQYQIHPELGWMHARIQTWFPFHIQIAINGREWLSQQMAAHKLAYHKHDNCLVWVEDYSQAQTLLDRQLETHWATLLDGFARQLNPMHDKLFERYTSEYYWTSFQSERATDIVFRQNKYLARLMPLLVRHSVLNFSCADVMRYLGRKVNLSGEIPAHFSGTLQADLKRRPEGERVKYRMNGNATKFYDKAYTPVGSVLRVETTVTHVEDFRVFRPKQGGSEDDLAWRPMRRSIADIHRRAEVSQKANDRLLDALSDIDDSRSLEELTDKIQKRTVFGGRPVRALRPWADDKSLLAAINRGEFLINGFRNRDIQKLVFGTGALSDKERSQRSAMISRRLRMLRAHGLIQKVNRTHRYLVPPQARAILAAVLTSAKTSVRQLNELAKAA